MFTRTSHPFKLTFTIQMQSTAIMPYHQPRAITATSHLRARGRFPLGLPLPYPGRFPPGLPQPYLAPGRFPPGLPQPHHSRFPPGLLQPPMRQSRSSATTSPVRRSRASATTSFSSAELCRIYARAVGAKQLKTSAWPALLHALERCTASGDSPPATNPIDSVE